MLCIKGARVMNPRTGMDEKTDLYIRDGVIAAYGACPQGETPSETIHANGLVATTSYYSYKHYLHDCLFSLYCLQQK